MVPTRSGEGCGLDPGQETLAEGLEPGAVDLTQHAAMWSLIKVSVERIFKR